MVWDVGKESWRRPVKRIPGRANTVMGVWIPAWMPPKADKDWEMKFVREMLLLGETLRETAHPGQAPQQPFAWVVLWQVVLVKKMKLTSHHQPEEFGKGQKETPLVLPISQNPHRRNASWLSNVRATRKNPESEWLARGNPETNPITIKSNTGSHVAAQLSWIPLPSCSLMGPLPNKVSSFVSMCLLRQFIFEH